MGQAKLKTKRKRFIYLMIKLSSKYNKFEIQRFADIRKLK